MMSTEEQREMDRLKAVNEGLQLQIQRKDGRIERFREAFKKLQRVTDQARNFPIEYEDFVQRVARQALEDGSK